MERRVGSPAGERNNGGCIQIIDGDGKFDDHNCQKFQADVKLAACERSYVLVSIIGPQSSGKSTLLNNVFGTHFEQMDPLAGERPKCTSGIWLERADTNEQQPILVMDLEGTDGKEKQDNTTFEKQSALFALLISDVVLINMWYHEIGRQQAANRPLFDIVFKAVVRLFSPRKTTLMFVIHDTDDLKSLCKMSMKGKRSSFDKCSEEDWKAKQKENLKGIEHSLKEDIRQIWDSFSKPEAHERTSFSAFYDVEVVFLSRPSDDGQFENELDRLRKKFRDTIAPGVLAGDRKDVVDGSTFSCNAQLLWKKIKMNEDLDLPAHKIMVATVRCEQIAKKMFESFEASKEWDELCKDVRNQTISDFGKKLSEMIKNCLSNYNKEATYFDTDVKLEKRKQLKVKLVQLVHPTYLSMLQDIKSESLEYFKAEFDKALYVGGEKFIDVARECANCVITQFGEKCRDARIDQANWNESDEDEVLGKLQRDMSAHILKEKQLQMSSDQDRKDKCNQMLIKGGCFAELLMLGMEIAIFKTPILSLRQPLFKATILQQLAAAAAGTAAIGAADGNRTMDEVADWIVELLKAPSSVPGENQLDV